MKKKMDVRFLSALLGALCLSACDVSPGNSSDAAVEADQSEMTLKAILAQNLKNPALSNALNARLSGLREDPSAMRAELLDAGFSPVGNQTGDLEEAEGEGCETFVYTGVYRTLLAEDDTVRIRLKECRNADLSSTSQLTVSFGDE